MSQLGHLEGVPQLLIRGLMITMLINPSKNWTYDSPKCNWKNKTALRLHGMSWGVKTTCFKAARVSLGGSGVSIGGVRILRVVSLMVNWWFGAQWSGFLRIPENKKDCHLGVCIPRPKPPGPKPWMLMVFFGIRFAFFWLPPYMQLKYYAEK